LRGLLKILVKTDGEFGTQVGKLCVEVCQEANKSSDSAGGSRWLSFGKKRDAGTSLNNSSNSTAQELERKISSIVSQEILNVVGPDAALTIDERKERRVAELQAMVTDADGDEGDSFSSKLAIETAKPKSVASKDIIGGNDGGLEGVLAEFQNEGLPEAVDTKEGETRIVKRRKYAI